MHIKEKMHEIKDSLKSYFSKGPKLTLILMLVMMCATFYVVNMKKNVTISIDGNDKQVTTLRSSLKSLLKDKNIVLDPKDVVSPGLDSKLKDGEKITIKKALNVTVTVDGKILKLKSSKSTVGDMLKDEGILLNDGDKLSAGKAEVLKNGFNMEIVRVDTRTVLEKGSVDFSTVVQKNDDMIKDTSKVVQEGQTGEKQLSYEVVFENGKEVSRKLVKEAVTKAPIDKIVAVGTLGVIFNPSRGDNVVYKNTISLTATAYTAGYASCQKNPGDPGYGVTASGTVAKRNSGGYSSVAVDPRVIPIGTKLYIPGYGLAIAEDTGGAIKGNRIDLFFNSESEALNYGIRNVTVYIVK